MIKIPYDTLSVNDCWQGRRFKTKMYRIYETNLYNILPDFKIPEGKLKINLEFGFSNTLRDIDNPIKPLLDIFQKKYGFNDKRVFAISIEKKIVKRGEEYFKFAFVKYD